MILTHKEVEPRYKVIFTIYTCLTKFQNDIFIYVCSWVRILVLYIVLCQEQEKSMLILDIDDYNTIYVFISKGTCVVKLSLNLQ
jgi:hypothetical protein